MKHIKKFFENKSSISFEDAKSWIRNNYTEEKVTGMIDDEISSGDWIDREQMEDEGYEEEYDYYIDYGNGEAESAVIKQIIDDLKSNFDLDFYELNDDTELYDFIKDEFNITKD